MPRNTTGGSGHRSQRNSEGSKARHNRCFVDDLLDDIKNDEKLEDVFVARVTKRMGSGRMEVFYVKRVEKDEAEQKNDKDIYENRVMTQVIPMRGGLRGKGKKSVWVDLDSLVMVADTGLGGTTHEIVAVFSQEQVARLKKLKPDMDARYFIKGAADEGAADDGFEFDASEDAEIDVDNI